MTSYRHKMPSRAPGTPTENAYLDAAREALLAVGWSRTTLTDIARRAGVSRMTLYRTWPDMGSLLGDLMTREWAALLCLDDDPDHRTRIVHGVVATVAAVRGNAVFARLIELDPQLLLPYLLERSGRSQDLVIELLTAQITAGQQARQIRAGDPGTLARSIMLAAHGFTLSAHTMGEPADFDRELRTMLLGYLRP
jgi:AcrR family transcriptional regulator